MTTDNPTKPRTIPPWTQVPCDECGCEYQASRTREVTATEFVCAECVIARRIESRRDAEVATLRTERDDALAERDRLREDKANALAFGLELAALRSALTSAGVTGDADGVRVLMAERNRAAYDRDAARKQLALHCAAARHGCDVRQVTGVEMRREYEALFGQDDAVRVFHIEADLKADPEPVKCKDCGATGTRKEKEGQPAWCSACGFDFDREADPKPACTEESNAESRKGGVAGPPAENVSASQGVSDDNGSNTPLSSLPALGVSAAPRTEPAADETRRGETFDEMPDPTVWSYVECDCENKPDGGPIDGVTRIDPCEGCAAWGEACGAIYRRKIGGAKDGGA